GGVPTRSKEEKALRPKRNLAGPTTPPP
ncbi:hypothetical protein CCACVL1_04185, partial [Corchorus capsularis]